ncbi:hypothetical protein A3E42_03375 [Candidatus Gottesmanbacteria bacterium RIFCSPHIGHO2_12_FULL_40_13]|nr:MAG: hypothetical protein A3E42_03375 [Candidatus Gottesmanbacteria bacterium RIFCSPHIGHO2_12_FULL_40_13]
MQKLRFLFPAFLLLLFAPSGVFAQNNLPPLLVRQNTPVKPQISFGDLLANKYSQNPIAQIEETDEFDKLTREKYEKIQNFLKTVEENGKKQLTEFYGNSTGLNSGRNTLGVNSQSKQLVDSVNQYFITPVPTLNQKLEQILAQINLKPENISADVPLNFGQSGFTPLKNSYTIALLGDSMTDTLGENLPHLAQILKENYPRHNFTLLNYGQGSTDIESGLYRLTNPTKYLNRDFPPLLDFNPDIIVIESFAYNHWGGELTDLNRQWQALVNIIETIKNRSPETDIILAATISPNPFIFGDGVLNWPKDLKWDSALTTKAYLQNLMNFAGSARLPLADAYTPSLDNKGHGDPKYINSADHLHPSEEGKLLISQKIFDVIKNNNLIR